jgi:hypothetical protein
VDGSEPGVFDHSSFDTTLESSLGEVVGAAAFDAHGNAVKETAKHGHFGMHHEEQVSKWSIDIRVFPSHFAPFEIRIQANPSGALPVAGQQTFISKQRNQASAFDLKAIYEANASAGQSRPDVAEALTAAGPDASRLFVLLPGVPRITEPTWTPLATSTAPSDLPTTGTVTATEATCPNCGAPLAITPQGTCQYCEVPITLQQS